MQQQQTGVTSSLWRGDAPVSQAEYCKVSESLENMMHQLFQFKFLASITRRGFQLLQQCASVKLQITVEIGCGRLPQQVGVTLLSDSSKAEEAS